MIDKTTQNTPPQEEKGLIQTLRNSLMIILTLIFVILYAAAFSGKLDPLKDNTMLLRLEPIIFVLIGYYFGRHPVRHSEKTLKDEIARQTQRADAAQYAKEKALQEREMLEEKIKNARTTLKTILPSAEANNSVDYSKAVKATVNILDS